MLAVELLLLCLQIDGTFVFVFRMNIKLLFLLFLQKLLSLLLQQQHVLVSFERLLLLRLLLVLLALVWLLRST